MVDCSTILTYNDDDYSSLASQASASLASVSATATTTHHGFSISVGLPGVTISDGSSSPTSGAEKMAGQRRFEGVSLRMLAASVLVAGSILMGAVLL